VFAADASTTAVNPTDVTFTIANDLRIASLSIAAYEYVTSHVSSTPHYQADTLAAQLSHHSSC
jgi:hypothetical protein